MFVGIFHSQWFDDVGHLKKDQHKKRLLVTNIYIGRERERERERESIHHFVQAKSGLNGREANKFL